jgi:pimeloyl-ACP methyl ester carboxylesterase
MLVPSTDGVTVALHDLGGNGPPLLLAHANGFLALAYRELAERLAADFRVWGVDLRAHGDASRPADGGLVWWSLAADVLAAVDALGLGTGQAVVGVGHSMGGAALTMAELDRPGTFRALYLYEPVLVPAGTFPAAADNPMSSAARRRRAVFDSRDAAYENYAAKPPLDELTPGALRDYVDHGFADQPDGTVALKCRPEDEAELFRVGGDSGAFHRLGEIACRVTIARGGADSTGPAAFAPQQAEALPHGRLEVFDGLGHFGPLQDPDAVAASIRRMMC